MFHDHPSKCLICEKPRQKRCKGKKYKNYVSKKIGMYNAIQILRIYGILVNENRILCMDCWNNIIYYTGCIYDDLDTWNENIWDVINGRNKIRNIILFHKMLIICSNMKLSKVMNGTCLITKQKNVISNMMLDLFDKNYNDSKTLIKYYNQYFGVNKMQLLRIYYSALKCLRYDKTGITIPKWNGKETFQFDKKDPKRYYMVSLMMLLSKWRMNLPLGTMSSIFQVAVTSLAHDIYVGTAFLYKYSIKWLINTKAKLDKHRPNEMLRKMMNIGKKMNAVNGDGYRLKCQSPSHFQTQQFSYDAKHKYNAYNTIGFNTFTGYYIGFWPKKGCGSDGHHWDGHVLDIF